MGTVVKREEKAGASGQAPLVLELGAIEEKHRALVGGKAHSLGTLKAAGFHVPDGFALTTEALRRFVAANEVQRDIEKIGEQVKAQKLSLVESGEMLGLTRQRIVETTLPEDVRAALVEAYGKLSGGEPLAVAVRSSGTKEDLEGASFAGQYETFLNVRGEAALEDAVKRCWASIWRNRVLQYAQRKGGGTDDLSMSVVVQRLVPAEVSGVLFTVNPVTGREREVLVESVFGLGEALVGGAVNADRYVVDAATGAVVSREIASKAKKIVALAAGSQERRPGGGASYTHDVALEGAEATRETLDPARLRELADLAARIQEHYGRPMDVEWVLEGGALHVVQARPITKLSFAPDTGEWTTADLRDGGVSSDVCSPFMWSLYEYCLETTMPQYLKELRLLAADHQARWTKFFFARGYWNLGLTKEVLAKIPGFVERNFDTDLGVEVTYEGQGRTTPTTVGGIAGALPVLFALKRHYKERIAKNEQFKASFRERVAPFDVDPAEIAKLARPDFVARYRELMTKHYYETETSYFYTIYNTSNSKMDFKVSFEKANKAVGGDLSYTKLVSGLENLSHLRPIADMHRLLGEHRKAKKPLDDATVRAYAHRWRQHGRKELDIRVPRWVDDLEHVRSMLEQGLAAWDEKHDPEASAHAQHVQYVAERDRALAALGWWRPFARSSFRDGLEQVRTYAWWREEMRDHSSFAYYLVRLWTVEAARRLVASGHLGEADDVWYLTFQETLAALEEKLAHAAAKAQVAAGRRLVRSFRNFEPPHEIGTRYQFHEAAPVAAGTDALKGTACSPGRVEGRAKVVKTLDQAKKVEKGDLLITVFTDPGWTPLLGLVGGVVTETGGLLSHAAVISREYGIPAVLAVNGATATIRDGDTVVIDGTTGTVTITKRASP